MLNNPISTLSSVSRFHNHHYKPSQTSTVFVYTVSCGFSTSIGHSSTQSAKIRITDLILTATVPSAAGFKLAPVNNATVKPQCFHHFGYRSRDHRGVSKSVWLARFTYRIN